MSVICSVCENTIYAPDSVWYAGTHYSFNVQWLCGTCLAKIPEEKRIPCDELRLFDLSFGVVYADIGSRGAYQWCDSRQGPVRFWVKRDDIDEIYPACILLSELYPFYNTENYLRLFAKAIREGKYNSEESNWHLLKDLLLLGRVTESFLLYRKPEDLTCKAYAPYEIPREFDDTLIAEADKIKTLILEHFNE